MRERLRRVGFQFVESLQPAVGVGVKGDTELVESAAGVTSLVPGHIKISHVSVLP